MPPTGALDADQEWASAREFLEARVDGQVAATAKARRIFANAADRTIVVRLYGEDVILRRPGNEENVRLAASLEEVSSSVKLAGKGPKQALEGLQDLKDRVCHVVETLFLPETGLTYADLMANDNGLDVAMALVQGVFAAVGTEKEGVANFRRN